MKTITVDELVQRRSEIESLKLRIGVSKVIRFSNKGSEKRLIDRLDSDQGLLVFNFPSELMYNCTLRRFVRQSNRPGGLYDGPAKYELIQPDPSLSFRECSSIIAVVDDERYEVIDNTSEDKDCFEIFDCNDKSLQMRLRPIGLD